MRQIITRVLGVCNKNADGHSRQKILEKFARPGHKVVLNHVRSAEGDPNTIEVLLQGEEGKKAHCIGFLPGRIGEKLARHLDANHEITAVITSLPVGEEPSNKGVTLRISY